MKPVATNQLQRGLNKIHNENLSPGTGTVHTALGNIIEVYDTDRLVSTLANKSLERELLANPGLLFAKVKLLDGRMHTLPFKDPEDQIYSTYGNSTHLEGRRVKIEWTGININNGHIVLTRTHSEPGVSITQAGLVFDIGNIV